jgi:glutaredoxin-related protein
MQKKYFKIEYEVDQTTKTRIELSYELMQRARRNYKRNLKKFLEFKNKSHEYNSLKSFYRGMKSSYTIQNKRTNK